MIKPEIHPTVIFRVPRFPYNQLLAENWDELKECIKFSSPTFYNIIANMTFADLRGAEQKIQFTVSKYYNRAVFRSTPFGLFSAIGVTTTDWNKGGEVMVATQHKVHAFSDWRNKPILSTVINKLIACNVLFFTNSTFYIIGKEIRYIQKSEDEYRIAAIEEDKTVLDILRSCNIPKTFIQLYKLTNIEKKLLMEYLGDLLQLQLLLTSEHPNIIGKDYFTRIGRDSLSMPDNQYLITERKAVTGQLDQKLFRHLPDLVLKMQQILGLNESSELKDFKERFYRKFDQAEVPLMVALDPEAGVGYGGMEGGSNNVVITDILPASKKQKDLSAYGDLKDIMYKLILAKNTTGESIELDELIEQRMDRKILPNSIQAICTLVDGDLYLDSLGGASTNALIGRFAFAVSEINTHCKEIAQIEQQSNPGVLLFDVGYTKEDRIDNINRRPAIYDFQFNILNYDTSDAPLSANDISISIQRGEVVLRSISLDKRIVPRFASSYNHKRSDLSLFRLLMDLQTQGLQSNLSFRPWSLLPKIPYYPRVQFKNIVVAPATWLVEKSLIKDAKSLPEKCKKLYDYLSANVPCSFIKAGLGDQTLLLDITKIDDVTILATLLEKESHLYLEEAHLPKAPTFLTNDGQTFLSQLIVTLTHKEQVFYPLKTTIGQTSALDKKVWISPGNDWLYFEIYMNPLRSDEFLHGKIKPFLRSQKALIRSWFFIRYNENGNHIRLRLQLKDLNKGYGLISAFSLLLKEDLDAGIISDIKLCTYKKEVHRYSAYLINQVESIFYKDSKYVLSMLGTRLPDLAKYRICVDLLSYLFDAMVIPEQTFDRIIAQVSEGLKKEHQIEKEGLKKINQMFKDFQQQKPPMLSKHSLNLYQNLKKAFIEVFRNCPVNFKPRLIADLMHMHINRLFHTDQRLHELAIYEFYNSSKKHDRHLYAMRTTSD